MCALSPSCNLHKAISLVNEICICATCSAKTFAFVSVMCDKLENQAFYANANAHRPPSGRCRQQQQQQCTFSLTSFYHFAFSPVCLLLLYVFFVFPFFLFFLLLAAHGVRQLFEQTKLLIRYVFNFDKDSRTHTISQQQQLRHFRVSFKISVK